MNWNLRFAPHLGYRPPFEPLFAESAGSPELLDQIAFARECGFAGVQYAAARSRPVEEQLRVGSALARAGLEAGCMLYTPFDKLRSTVWSQGGAAARVAIAGELHEAFEVARRIGSRRIVVLGGADAQRPIAMQHAAFADHLRFAADLAERAGVVLCLETLSRKSIPDMLLQHIGDALAIVRSVAHPALRLVFDTSHVQIMDGDLLSNLQDGWDAIETVQLADNPGRLEPGSGEIDFESVLRLLHEKSHRGLVELEHGWARPGIASERLGLAALRRLDAAAAAPRP